MTMQGCAKPDDKKFLLKPVQQAMADLKNIKTKDPKFSNHV